MKRYLAALSVLVMGSGLGLVLGASPANADPYDCETDFLSSVRTYAVCYGGFGEYRAYVQCTNGSTYYAPKWTRVDDWSFAECPAGRGTAHVAGVEVH